MINFFRHLAVVSTLILLFLFRTGVCADVFVTQNDKKAAIETTDLVNILHIDSTIKVDLKYSTTDNFTGEDVYGELDICYLRKEAAEKLAAAQRYLKASHPELSIIVYDGLRPRSVQWTMWEVVKGTDMQKYVAYPTSGSIHNYGCAVDVGIVDSTGEPLDMGTEFDYFGDLAQPRYEKKFFEENALTQDHLKNRELLRNVMGKAGFRGITVEWWHFNAFPKQEVKSRFSIVEDVIVR